MQVKITCRHGKISDDIRSLITSKSEKLLTYFERVTEIAVTVDFEGEDRVRVELQVDAEHKHDFVSHDEGTGSVQTVFESALHKMEQQIKKYKSKLQDHRRDRPIRDMAGNGEEEEATD